MFRNVCAFSLLMLLAAGSAAAERELSFPIHEPDNVYWQGDDVILNSIYESSEASETGLELVISDYRHQEILRRRQTIAITASTPQAVDWNLGILADGYYEATLESGDSKATTAFAVAPHIMRSATEARAAGSRIGLKMWYLGNAWWRGNLDWDERAAVTATTGLGLQWTRALLQQTSHLSTVDLVNDFPMNVIFKVERFPADLYDTERYGPMAEWEAANGKGAWTLKTLPRKEPYQAWLREQVAQLPAEQNVFEIWNEAWDKMTAEDLATVSTWIAEVIRAERPDAIIGPNLRGETSRYSYDAKFIDAGGMADMQMVCLHPYAASEDRAWLREYQAWLRERLGRDIAIYVTEYGSHSTPEGPAKRSEAEQAQRVVTQTLSLYAEGVVAMTPHWMGQREENPVYHEDWFGFIRLDGTPKPVLVALAACARQIDGGRYLGDLWFGPGIAAMLFEKDGTRVLALYTKEGNKSIAIDLDADNVHLFNLMGSPQPLLVEGRRATITVEPDVQYLVGVGPALAAQASNVLRPDLWGDSTTAVTRTQRALPRCTTAPTIDGDMNDWNGRLQIALVNPKVNGDDASGLAGACWDDHYLYLALQARDNQILNTRPTPKLYQQDSLEIFLSTEVRDDDAGYGPHDHQFWIAPTSADKTPLLAQVTVRASGQLAKVPGAAFAVKIAKNGWSAEAAIPWQTLEVTPKPGMRIALDLRMNDADSSHERWKIDPEDSRIDTENPTRWAVMTLQGAD
jgi:hypothetical protein